MRSVILHQVPGHPLGLRVALSGRDGTLDLLPPNPGTAARATLTVPAGSSFHVAFGGVAGGEVRENGATAFKVVNASGAGICP